MTSANNQKGAALVPILIVLVVILAGATGYFVFVGKSVQVPAVDTSSNNAPNATPQEVVNAGSDNLIPANWRTYENKEFGFSLKYPAQGYDAKDDGILKTEVISGNRVDPQYRVMSVFSVPQPVEFGPALLVNVIKEGLVMGEGKGSGLEQWIRIQKGNTLLSLNKTYINGAEWLEVRAKDSYFNEEVSRYLYTVNGNLIFSVSYTYNPNNPSAIEDTLKKVASTFVFNNRLIIGEGGDYRDERYRFRFRYPSGWGVREILPPSESKNIYAKTYSLFESEDEEIAGDRVRLAVRLYVLTKGSKNEIAIAGGADDLLWYDFNEDKFFHGTTFGGEKEYEWESVKSATRVDDMLYTSQGLPIIKSGSFFPSPNVFNDIYFTVSRSKNMALLLELKYSGDQGVWISRSGQGMLLKDEQRIVEVRNMLENLVQSLVFEE